MASSNFVNVVGAIGASLLFKGLVVAAGWVGIITLIPQEERAHGRLVKLEYEEGRPAEVVVETADGKTFRRTTRQLPVEGEQLVDRTILEVEQSPAPESEVVVTRYEIPRGGYRVAYYRIQPASAAIEPVFNKERLPTYLFLSAALMTLGILILLCRQLPDFFVRALLWLRSHGRYHLKVIGVNNLPSEGPVILATNCDRFDDCMQVLAATDRYARFILVENPADEKPPPLLRFLAKQTGLVVLPARQDYPAAWDMALAISQRELGRGNMVGITVDGSPSGSVASATGVPKIEDGGSKIENRAGEPGALATVVDMEKFLEDMRGLSPTVIVPVYCGTAAHMPNGAASTIRRIRVVIGHPMSPNTSFAEARREIAMLGQWIRFADQGEANPATIMIPGGSGQSPQPAKEQPSGH